MQSKKREKRFFIWCACVMLIIWFVAKTCLSCCAAQISKYLPNQHAIHLKLWFNYPQRAHHAMLCVYMCVSHSLSYNFVANFAAEGRSSHPLNSFCCAVQGIKLKPHMVAANLVCLHIHAAAAGRPPPPRAHGAAALCNENLPSTETIQLFTSRVY